MPASLQSPALAPRRSFKIVEGDMLPGKLPAWHLVMARDGHEDWAVGLWCPCGCGQIRKGSLPKGKRRLPGARSSRRAGSAVELRPAPKTRHAAHPQERQHSAAAGGTRDRVRPESMEYDGQCGAMDDALTLG
jgi:hypothetical protein